MLKPLTPDRGAGGQQRGEHQRGSPGKDHRGPCEAPDTRGLQDLAHDRDTVCPLDGYQYFLALRHDELRAVLAGRDERRLTAANNQLHVGTRLRSPGDEQLLTRFGILKPRRELGRELRHLHVSRAGPGQAVGDERRKLHHEAPRCELPRIDLHPAIFGHRKRSPPGDRRQRYQAQFARPLQHEPDGLRRIGGDDRERAQQPVVRDVEGRLGPPTTRPRLQRDAVAPDRQSWNLDLQRHDLLDGFRCADDIEEFSGLADRTDARFRELHERRQVGGVVARAQGDRVHGGLSGVHRLDTSVTGSRVGRAPVPAGRIQHDRSRTCGRGRQNGRRTLDTPVQVAAGAALRRSDGRRHQIHVGRQRCCDDCSRPERDDGHLIAGLQRSEQRCRFHARCCQQPAVARVDDDDEGQGQWNHSGSRRAHDGRFAVDGSREGVRRLLTIREHGDRDEACCIVNRFEDLEGN